jgi:hypothetical protein
MADSVHEQIMKQIQATLEGITIANGFGHTMVSVQRFLQQGQTLAETPVCVLLEGEDSVKQEGPLAGAYSLTSRTMMVSVVAIHQEDTETDARSASEVMNAIVLDIQKALQADPTRGGLALDTSEIGVGELNSDEGQPEIIQTVAFSISYRHRRTDPTIAG